MAIQIFGVKELKTTLDYLGQGQSVQNELLERIAIALESGMVGGGEVTSKVYLLDDDGLFLLDDSGKKLYLDDSDSWLTGEVQAGNGVYHFIPVLKTQGTHALLPATPGKYYQVAFVFLSATEGDTSWELRDGSDYQTGYTAGDIGFGAVIPLAENLFKTTTGNALNLVVTGNGTIKGHVVAYEYGN